MEYTEKKTEQEEKEESAEWVLDYLKPMNKVIEDYINKVYNNAPDYVINKIRYLKQYTLETLIKTLQDAV